MNATLDLCALTASCIADELSDDECAVLAAIMGVRHLAGGERLVSEGEADTTLFVLVAGRLGVANHFRGRETHIYTMTPGECAGTRAFVDRTPRKATLRAIGDATVYTLTPEPFASLQTSHPRIAYKVMRALFRMTHSNLMRMNEQNQELVNYVSKAGGRY